MRKVVTWLILMAGLMLLVVPGVRAQVVNGGFENWTGGKPDGWVTLNIPGYFLPITQSTASHSGTYAMQGSVALYFDIAGPPIASNTSPVSQRYAYLTGYYRFTPAGGDTFGVVVLMNHQSVTMGAGDFLTGAAASAYTQFSVPITYGLDVVPDSCHIQIFIAHPDSVHLGSTFLVDDLSFGGTANSVEAAGEEPAQYQLHQNYPNPFNPTTTIRYELPHRSFVSLAVFNPLGQQLVQLVNAEMESGSHEVKFDAGGLSSGVYYYRLQAGNYVSTKSLLLVK